jgi:hypothetical protein
MEAMRQEILTMFGTLAEEIKQQLAAQADTEPTDSDVAARSPTGRCRQTLTWRQETGKLLGMNCHPDQTRPRKLCPSFIR